MRKLFLACLLAVFAGVGLLGANTVDVYFIDVGQGDAILIDYGAYELLIDGGSSGSCIPVLAEYVDGYLEVVVATHPHSDHIGGLDDVLRAFDVLQVITNGASADTNAYRDFTAVAVSEVWRIGVVQRNEQIQLGDLVVQVLHPHQLTGDVNEDSLVLQLTYEDVNFLFTGDIGEEAEHELLGMECLADIDILKVAHHGSHYSSTQSFLDVVQPELAVYSAGVGNRYGHPHDEALGRLSTSGVLVLGTDTHGTIRVSTDGETWSVTDLLGTVLGGDPQADGVDLCQICIDRLNSATYDDFRQVDLVGVVRATNLVAAQPFSLTVCAGAASIESMLDAVGQIGETLRERIARHFCPDLYKE